MLDWFSFEMTPKQRDKWRQTRQRGELFYVLIRGVLLYAGPLFIFTIGWSLLANQQPLATRPVLVGAVIWVCTGLLFGIFMWSFNEGRFKRLEEAQNLQSNCERIN